MFFKKKEEPKGFSISFGLAMIILVISNQVVNLVEGLLNLKDRIIKKN